MIGFKVYIYAIFSELKLISIICSWACGAHYVAHLKVGSLGLGSFQRILPMNKISWPSNHANPLNGGPQDRRCLAFFNNFFSPFLCALNPTVGAIRIGFKPPDTNNIQGGWWTYKSGWGMWTMELKMGPTKSPNSFKLNELELNYLKISLLIYTSVICFL